MTFRDQIQSVREAEILIGNHGAGLTHLLFMDSETHVVEFGRALPFFDNLMPWKGSVGRSEIAAVHFEVSPTYLETFLVPTLAAYYRQHDKNSTHH